MEAVKRVARAADQVPRPKDVSSRPCQAERLRQMPSPATAGRNRDGKVDRAGWPLFGSSRFAGSCAAIRTRSRASPATSSSRATASAASWVSSASFGCDRWAYPVSSRTRSVTVRLRTSRSSEDADRHESVSGLHVIHADRRRRR
jgi:hypothetical protein